jgi:hypothetical protein
MGDKQRRKRLASLPFSEELKILEKLRDRSRAIAVAGMRKATRPQQEQPTRRHEIQVLIGVGGLII